MRSSTHGTLAFLVAAGAAALLVWGVRRTAAPTEDAMESEPVAPIARPISEDDAPARETLPAPAVEASAPPSPAAPPAPASPPLVRKEVDLHALDTEALWRIGQSGSPSVGIPERVAALEELLGRTLAVEDRVRALSSLAFSLRSLNEATQSRQVEVLRELIGLAGEESEMGHRAAVQMGWPLWELGRKEEAYRTVQQVITSPAAGDRYRGLASWAAMIFAIDLDRLDEAEEHFARLQSIREPGLSSTQVLARQRIAAARRGK